MTINVRDNHRGNQSRMKNPETQEHCLQKKQDEDKQTNTRRQTKFGLFPRLTLNREQ